MADTYNLIPAAELPTTEADEVDVLCVENGEIKLKAAANLGGGGGGGYVIHVPASDTTVNESDVEVMLTESYDNFAPVLEAGGAVWLDMTEALSEQYGGMTIYINVIQWVYLSEEGVAAIGLMGLDFMGSLSIQVTAFNGTWTPTTTASTGEAEA